MASYKNVILESKALEVIYHDIKAGRVNHTYLFVSEDDDYMLEFAQVVSALLLNVTENHSSMVKIEKGIHPDVIVLGKNEKINAAAASSLTSDAYVRPLEGDNKVYILMNIDDAGEEAQNKLLKIIEEPPKTVYFLLCAKKENKLLQTVLSRSKKIELDPLTAPQIEKMLIEAGVEPKTASICAACGAGVFKRAFKMASDKDFIELYKNVFRCLYKMNSSRDILEFATLFSAKSINLEEFSDIMMLAVRDLMMAKLSKTDLIVNKHKTDELLLIAEGYSMTALYKIIEYCLQLKEDLVYNTLSVSVVDEFLLKIVEAKVKCKK